MPPNIKGEAIRGVDELEGRWQCFSVGRVLVIVKGVIDPIVFAEWCLRVWPGGNDDDFAFDVFRRIIVIVVDQLGRDALRAG